MSVAGRRVTGSLMKLVQPRRSRSNERTTEGSGRRIDQAEILTAITALSLVRSLEVSGLHRVAVVQVGASAGDDGFAFLEPAANLDIGVGSKSGGDPPGFHHAVTD